MDHIFDESLQPSENLDQNSFANLRVKARSTTPPTPPRRYHNEGRRRISFSDENGFSRNAPLHQESQIISNPVLEAALESSKVRLYQKSFISCVY